MPEKAQGDYKMRKDIPLYIFRGVTLDDAVRLIDDREGVNDFYKGQGSTLELLVLHVHCGDGNFTAVLGRNSYSGLLGKKEHWSSC